MTINNNKGEDHEKVENGCSCEFSQQTLNRSLAYKKYMEHFYEDMNNSRKLRLLRRERLEKQLEEARYSEKEKKEMRKRLFQKETEYMRLKRAKITADNFETIKIIGKGAFGEVRLVSMKGTGELYAMKKMKKGDMIEFNQVNHVHAERDLMALNHYLPDPNPWIVELSYSFTDEKYLYLIMEYVPGGDMMTMLIRHGTLTEPQARFYIAETVLAVESVHKLNYIHRDIKPDNLLIDRDGHLKLSDFGLCMGLKSGPAPRGGRNFGENSMNTSTSLGGASWRPARRECAHSTVGTPDYISPEALLQKGYHEGSDLWSVGVLLYEMLVGFPPFCADTPEETYRKILNFKRTLVFPDTIQISYEAKDLIRRLLCDETERLGTTEIMCHPFFKNINWDSLRDQNAPIVPSITSPTDTSNFDEFDDNEFDDTQFDENKGKFHDYINTGNNGDNSYDECGFKKMRTGVMEKMDKRFSVNDIHFIGYGFRSFDTVLNKPKTRPKSNTF